MYKFILGYFVGVFMALAVVFYTERPAHAFSDDEAKWYAVTMVMPVPGKIGYLLFEHAGSTKEDCEGWVKSNEFMESLADAMTDLMAKYPKIKVIGTDCQKPPTNSEGDPA